MPEIRPHPIASAEGRALCAALAREVDERYAGIDDDTAAEHPEPVLSDAETSPPHGVFLVAWLDGVAAACGALRRADPETAELKRMYTTPSTRRRGVSRAILGALEQRARDLGYRRVILETGLAQPEAVAMYESAGYERIATYGPYRDSPWSVCFGKDLT
jgi:GNAT superfamily N-acetyltransferase